MKNIIKIGGRIINLEEVNKQHKDDSIHTNVKFSLRNIDDYANENYISCIWSDHTKSDTPFLKIGAIVEVIGSLRNSSFKNDKGEKKYYSAVVVRKAREIEPELEDKDIDF